MHQVSSYLFVLRDLSGTLDRDPTVSIKQRGKGGSPRVPTITGVEVCALEVDDDGVPRVLGGGGRTDVPQQGAVITRVWSSSSIVSCRGEG
jgi:hypothetical protein